MKWKHVVLFPNRNEKPRFIRHLQTNTIDVSFALRPSNVILNNSSRLIEKKIIQSRTMNDFVRNRSHPINEQKNKQ